MKPEYLIHLLLVLLLGLILSCSEETEEVPEKDPPPPNVPLVANITVETINASNQMFRNPVFSRDGNKLFFSATVNTGLWMHDLNLDTTYRLNNRAISVGDYTSDLSGNHVLFIHSSYDKKKKKRQFYVGKQKLDAESSEDIYSSGMRLSQLELSRGDNISFFERDSLIIMNINTGRKYDWGDKDVAKLKASKGTIVEYTSGNKSRYTVVVKGNVLWPQYFDETQLIFNGTGKGTFLYNRTTGATEHIGFYDHPVYNRSSSLLAFLKERSDGHTVTSSRIYVMNVGVKNEMAVDPANNYVEENPSWSPDGNKLVYNTVEGKIQLARLEFTQ